MEEKSKVDLETRLKAVAYMRQSAMESQNRLENARQILLQDKTGFQPETLENTNQDKQNETGNEGVMSFLFRTGIVLLILVLFYIGKSAPNGKIGALLNTCKKEISVDYSENIFDFIDRIPYTLNYEKINAEGRDPIKN